MLKARTLKGLALLSVTAFLSNSVINNTLLTTPDGEDAITLDDYDDILASISRRLQLSPANDRLRSVRAHHAQMLMERGIDPHSSRFKELMRERMKRVHVKRRERGGERKILRKLELRGESVWKGTPLTMLETGMVSLFFVRCQLCCNSRNLSSFCSCSNLLYLFFSVSLKSIIKTKEI